MVQREMIRLKNMIKVMPLFKGHFFMDKLTSSSLFKKMD